MSKLRLWTLAEIAAAAFTPAPNMSEGRVRMEFRQHLDDFEADARAHRARQGK